MSTIKVNAKMLVANRDAEANADGEISELTIEEQFQKMEHKEHALELPDTYIGSVEIHEEPMWVIDEDGIVNETEKENRESLNEDVESNIEEMSNNTTRDNTPASSRTASRATSRSVSSSGLTRMMMRRIKYVPGLYKIYDEVLVNAIDHWTRMAERIALQDRIKKGLAKETPEVTLKMKFKPVKTIKVEIDQESGCISVFNDGDGIPIAMHKEYGVYVPELLFSQFLTSGNYKGANVNQTKIIGGKNGYGAKLAALFSHEFTIETVDYNTHKKYIQTYRDNLNQIEEAQITDFKGMPYTKISFRPDLKRFGLDELTDDIVALFKKRVYDAAGWCSGVNVFYNDFRIPIRDFNQYTNLYLGSRTERKRYYVVVNDRWEVGVTYSDHQEFQQVSMVNGIITSKGGRHVDHVVDAITKKLAADISTEKNKVSPRTVKANMWVFIRCVIENPNFDSQTKEALTTKISNFGSRCELSIDDIKKIGAVGISKRAKDFSAFKDTLTSKATDGKKVTKVMVDKLEDADYAGSKKYSHRCVLILTEGDSAKGFALNGLKALTAEQRKFYGVFPLKGKMLNVRDAKQNQIDKNTEIASLKQILALQSGVDYTGAEGIKKLRYGKIMILTDSDHDGDHIKGLVINFIHKFWPSLMESDNFITTMITPIVIVWKERKRGHKTERNNIIKFYSENEFYEWKRQNNDGRGWKSRYYKGLATSKEADAQDCFKQPKMIQYVWDKEEEDEATGRKISPSDNAINLAFLKTNADLRKKWLQEADRDKINEYNITKESYNDFINHRLVHFSWADTYRSIPNICDGLKPSMRKIIYYCLKHNINNSLKVAQLGGKVSDATSYHHGEKSLEGTIVGLAQDYVGSNNINLLKPEGMFGTRFANGNDAGSARYIYTKLEDLTSFIFRKEDSMLYKYLTDDGFPIEPEWYLPIIPMVLVNGAIGIGTGYSTFIPQYNPIDLVGRLKTLLAGRSLPVADPCPWYRGFRGKIEAGNKGRNYVCVGDYQIYQNRVRIRELPIDVCFSEYKNFLELLTHQCSEEERKKRSDAIKGRFNPYSSILWGMVKDVHIDSSLCQAEVVFKPGKLTELLAKGVDKFEREMKLRSSIPVTNMVLFDADLEIKKYDTVNEIISEYFQIRKRYYELRKQLLVGETEFNFKRISSKLRFVQEIMDEKLVIYKKTRAEIIKLLEDGEYPRYATRFDPRSVLGDLYGGEKATVVEIAKVDDDIGDDGDGTNASYNYLLSMRIDSFSQEMLDKLKTEVDSLNQQLEEYKATTPEMMWEKDLSVFEKEYVDWMKDWYEEKDLEAPDMKSKTRIRVRNLSRKLA